MSRQLFTVSRTSHYFSIKQLSGLPMLIHESSHWPSLTTDFGRKLKNLPMTFSAVTAARPSMISLIVVPTSTQRNIPENI